MAEQTKFYYLPKERIVNLIDLPAIFNEDGTITIKLNNNYRLERKITLSDYLIPSNIVATPVITQFVGKLGTKIVIWGVDTSMLQMSKEVVDRVLKKYEL